MQSVTVSDNGNIASIKTKAYFHKDLPTRLFSPQAYLKELSSDECLKFFKDRAELCLNKDSKVTVGMNSVGLPLLNLLKSGCTTKALSAFNGFLVSTSNINLDPKTKLWLKWHYKLGHLAFEHVRSLGISDRLDAAANGLFKSELPQRK